MSPTNRRDYEVDRQWHRQALEARLPTEVEKLTWPIRQLHALRDERLRALVRWAQQRSPWHARRLRSIDPETLHGDDLSALPPMTKEELMAHWDEIVTDRRLSLTLANAHLARTVEHGPAYLLDTHHVVTSGGTSGRRGVFVWDFEGWLACQLASRRGELWLAQHGGRTGSRRWATVMAAHPTHISLFCYPGGVLVHPHVFRSVLGRVPEVVEYQVHQTTGGAEIAVRAASAIDLEPIRRELQETLARLGLSDPVISLSRVTALDRLSGTGKLKRFLPSAGDSERTSAR